MTNLLRNILSMEALNYLEEVLNYIRALVPDNIKVLLKEFCEALQIELL